MSLHRRKFIAGSVSAFATGLVSGCSSDKEGKLWPGTLGTTSDGTRGSIDVEALQESVSKVLVDSPWTDLYENFGAEMEAIRQAYADAGKVAAADFVYAVGTDLFNPIASAASAFMASPPESDDEVLSAIATWATGLADSAASLEAPLTAYLEELAVDGLPDQPIPQFDRAAGLGFFREREAEMRSLIAETDAPDLPVFQGLLKSVQEMQIRFGSESRAADPRDEVEAALAQLRTAHTARTARTAAGPPPPPDTEECADLEQIIAVVAVTFGLGGIVGGGAAGMLVYSSSWAVIGLTLLMLESFMFLVAFAIAAFALLILLVVVLNIIRVWGRYLETCLG